VIDAVAVARRRIRRILTEEAGGECTVCGYQRSHAALQFHHLDPATKAFTLRNGDTRSLARMRAGGGQVRPAVRQLPRRGRVRRRAASRTITDRAPSGVAQATDPG